MERIRDAVASLEQSSEGLTVEDLAPLDEFHIGGREATRSLIDKLAISSGHRVLDIGCGLGGAARFVTSSYQAHVTGIDITPSFIEAGRELTQWVGLQELVQLEVGNALDLPYPPTCYQRAYMLHVGMNIQNKESLFREVFRVLDDDGIFGLYDICRVQGKTLRYPVPWAADANMNHAATASQYQQALHAAGFEVVNVEDKHAFAMEFYQRIRKEMEKKGPAPLGLHLIMGEQTKVKLGHMIQGLQERAITPVEWVVKKRSV